MSEPISFEFNSQLVLYSLIFAGSLAIGYINEKLFMEYIIKTKNLQLLARTWLLIAPTAGFVTMDYTLNNSINTLDFLPAVLIAAGMAIGRTRRNK